MKLNCDLGEGAGSEAAVIPYIDQANIACGFHAGSTDLMREALILAKSNGVSIGAHPGYADREGFGRKSTPCNSDELVKLVRQQISALGEIAKTEGIIVDYVKPHGALYHDMLNNTEIRSAIYLAVSQSPSPLALMIQATAKIELHQAEASQAGVELWAEAFADRKYDNVGRLLPREEAGAVLDRSQMLQQVQQLVADGNVTTNAGNKLAVSADTLCVHGDHAEGVKGIRKIRKLLSNG